MEGERQVDPVELLLKNSATWEPPDGFVLRVITASRADVRKETAVPPPLAGIGAFDRMRARLSAFAARRENALWVLRQYWLLFRGR